MAEIVGFTASIIAIVELVRKATTLSYEYLRGVRRAPKDLGDLVCELGTLGKVLISVQHIADQSTQKLHVLHSLSHNNGPLHGIATELNAVISKLESASKTGFRGSVERLKWPLQEAETMQHISRIERYKSLFIFALSADQISLSNDLTKSVQKTELNIQLIEKLTQNTIIGVRDISNLVQGTNLSVEAVQNIVENTSLTLNNIRTLAEGTSSTVRDTNFVVQDIRRDLNLGRTNSAIKDIDTQQCVCAGLVITRTLSRAVALGPWYPGCRKNIPKFCSD
ncbi:uncharacterized protein LAJ45_09339 [Morchella importuna]|uniref:uncharacterized protein n=1 Tax=Morchella importuna TaxID=1174673 RepID=UPI001E8D6B52|nr:uncharacterized protein LAJ45_09339 [Morchella importuna]KAH8146656.1 hypothetical protein LAJ45_09339 [Morchella importuna]